MTTFAQRLRSARNERGLTQVQLIAAIGAYHKDTISRYEHSTLTPQLHTFTRLCDALGVSADWLLGRDG
jgi:transcriptional regulator with XRE-family HTH domain